MSDFSVAEFEASILHRVRQEVDIPNAARRAQHLRELTAGPSTGTAVRFARRPLARLMVALHLPAPRIWRLSRAS